MKLRRCSIVLYIFAALTTAGLSFGLGAAVFRARRTRVIRLERVVHFPSIPSEIMIGESNAPITLVEACDFECRFCRKVRPVIDKITEEYKEEIQYAFVPFPRGNVAYKEIYGVAYVAAMKQGAGAEFRAALFRKKLAANSGSKDRRRREAVADVEAVAEKLKLDLPRFKNDMESASTKTIWRGAVKAVNSAGLRATPTVYINGYRVRGALELNGYHQLIASVIDKDSVFIHKEGNRRQAGIARAYRSAVCRQVD
ncbi:MAG: thioredoxin domain-containing protein [Chitinivibrionales bacterium]|nr:thioredoxin domain-containing protein [Chitinivibrionales bacterium]MBD3358856.1 thioredoxin domain-containing protein [Chitinivibrionales bacterium]